MIDDLGLNIDEVMMMWWWSYQFHIYHFAVPSFNKKEKIEKGDIPGQVRGEVTGGLEKHG